MQKNTLIKNTTIVTDGKSKIGDVLIADGIIQQIGNIKPEDHYTIIDGTNKHLLPGVIDGQVHFRDPGLTHKGDLYTESKAAIAGGTTSFIDMPTLCPIY